MSHGLQLLATYTYSKVIDDASDVFPVDFSEIGISHPAGIAACIWPVILSKCDSRGHQKGDQRHQHPLRS
jgi:hypothetical protein